MGADVAQGAGTADHIAGAIDTVWVDSDGVHQQDITSLVNGWITGSIENNGIMIRGEIDPNIFGGAVYFASSRYAGNGYELGDLASPSITAAVSEPSTLGLMFDGLGLVVLIAYRSKKQEV